MAKATVIRLFIGSFIAVAAGSILAIVAVALALANDVLVVSGREIVAVQASPLAWVLLGLAIVGGLAIMGGLIGGLISWIGALLNTAQLQNKTWFVALLLLGIFNFGLLGMIAYVIAGPDGTRQTAPHVAQAAA